MGTRTALLGTFVSRPQTDRSGSATGRCGRNQEHPSGCAVPKPSSRRSRRLPSGKERVPSPPASVPGDRSAAEPTSFAASCQMPRRPPRPACRTTHPRCSFGQPLPAPTPLGGTPCAVKGLREAHRAGSGGHGVEPGPAPMPARGPASRLPPQGLQLLDRRLGFRGDFAGRDDTGTRQRGVLRVAGRRGRRVVLEADRGLETSG